MRPSARWLIPPAAMMAFSGLAVLQRDPAAAAESRFLALLVAAVLASIAALARGTRGERELAWTALLAAAAGWIAYHGPSRGAVVTLVLALGLSLAGGRAFRRRLEDGRRLDFGVTVPAAFGLQVLLRSDLLLPPLLEARTLVSLLALPAAAGGAVSLLAWRFGGPRALLAGAAAAVLAPGWNVTATLGLVALAAGAVLTDRRRSPAMRRLAAVTLVLPLVWNPPLGVLMALAGLAPAIRGWKTSAAAALLLLLGGAAVTFFGAAGGWSPALALWTSGMTILPALVLAPAQRRWRAVFGLILTFLLALLGQRPEALAAGLALAALGTPAAGPAARLQHAWCGVLLAGTALLAGYPWMRIAPRADLMDLLGIGDGLLALGWLVGAIAILAALFAIAQRRIADRSGASRLAPELTVLLLAGLALGRAAEPSTVLLDSYGAVGLDGQNKHWRGQFPEQAVSELVLDTNLVHGVRLESGSPVAIVRLHGAEGTLASWELRAGDDTAEWAAARADVAAQPGFTAPPPWLSRLAPDGSFFARRFRTRLTVGAPAGGPPAAGEATAGATDVTVHVAGELPPEVRLVIYRLELRR